jgi:hypothetical protein
MDLNFLSETMSFFIVFYLYFQIWVQYQTKQITECTLLYQDFLEKERVVPNKEAIELKVHSGQIEKSSLVTAHIFYISSFAQKIM